MKSPFHHGEERTLAQFGPSYYDPQRHGDDDDGHDGHDGHHGDVHGDVLASHDHDLTNWC